LPSNVRHKGEEEYFCIYERSVHSYDLPFNTRIILEILIKFLKCHSCGKVFYGGNSRNFSLSHSCARNLIWNHSIPLYSLTAHCLLSRDYSPRIVLTTRRTTSLSVFDDSSHINTHNRPPSRISTIHIARCMSFSDFPSTAIILLPIETT
jgi:hypothetical protein